MSRIDKFERNLFINGDMNLWQRALSFTAISDSDYGPDMFQNRNAGTMVGRIDQDTDTPTFLDTSYPSKFSLKYEVTTAQPSLGVNDFLSLQTNIEGYNWSQLFGRPFVITFLAKSDLAGTYWLVAQGDDLGGGNRKILKSYTIDQVDTWEKKAILFPADNAISAYNFDNDLGLRVQWSLGAGSNLTSSSVDVWGTDSISTSGPGQANLNATINNTFNLSQVQIIGVGEGFRINDVDLPFRGAGRGFQEELAMTQRYFEKSGPLSLAMFNPDGTALGNLGSDGASVLNGSGGIDRPRYSQSFKVSKRAAPAMSFHNVDTGTATQARDTDSAEVSNVTALNLSENSFTWGPSSATANSDALWTVQWTASAEF